jgi:hypothetical protein
MRASITHWHEICEVIQRHENFSQRKWIKFGLIYEQLFFEKKAQMSTYIDTKKGDTVAMVPAVCNMSHFLDSTTVG